jgi:sarcosine oxidase subunit gamma
MSDLATADRIAVWTPCPAWDGIAAPCRFGAEGAGVAVTLHERLGIASIVAPAGGDEAVAEALKGFGLDLPRKPGAVRADGRTLVWSGPGQWLLVSDGSGGFADTLAVLAPHAAVADQSQSRAALRIGGPQARLALAKGCMLDLHDSAFPPGFAALTGIAHIGVQLWRAADAPASGEAAFEILVPRSMAGSFWSWLSASVAEFGCAVAAGGRG